VVSSAEVITEGVPMGRMKPALRKKYFKEIIKIFISALIRSLRMGFFAEQKAPNWPCPF
jgi:hypothetical protein